MICGCVVCNEGTEVATVKEWYRDRSDLLEEKEVDNIDKITTERFRRGRRNHLLCKPAFCSCPQRRRVADLQCESREHEKFKILHVRF